MMFMAAKKRPSSSKAETAGPSAELAALQTQIANLESRVAVLSDSNHELTTLFGELDLVVFAVDERLRVCRWTRPAGELLRPLEEGDDATIDTIAAKLGNTALADDVRAVFAESCSISREFQLSDGRWFECRLRHFQKRDSAVLVFVALVEFTQSKSTEERLEAANTKLELELSNRTELFSVVHEITAAVNLARTVDKALRIAVERICHYNGWQAGAVWQKQVAARNPIAGTRLRYIRDEAAFPRLDSDDDAVNVKDIESGLIAAASQAGESTWIEDLNAANLSIGDAALDALGLRSAAAFPIEVGDEIQAVLVFCSRNTVPRDDQFIDAMESIVIQLAHVIQRLHSERRLIEMSEVERQRLGREMHDTLGQQVSAIDILVTTLRGRLFDSPHAALLETLETNMATAKQQLQRIIKGLSPVDIDSHGLLAALKDLAIKTAQTHDVRCEFCSPHPVLLKDNFLATQLFLIAREAVHNAAKHARCSRIEIELDEQTGVQLTIRDDGIGIPSEKSNNGGMGLPTMKYRSHLIGGTIHIESQKSGTQIRCCVPAAALRKSRSATRSENQPGA